MEVTPQASLESTESIASQIGPANPAESSIGVVTHIL
jgi:hypothetical protein